METFIFSDLKKASLQKDYTKVLTLGPYASALSVIIKGGLRKKLENNS